MRIVISVFFYIIINHEHVSTKFIYIYIYFFYQGFLSQTLAINGTEGEWRGPSFILLYHFRPLTDIHTFICNFACEMTITYF